MSNPPTGKRSISIRRGRQHRVVLDLVGERQPGEDNGQMVPLINVVFLLMVFFLLAGSIGQRDKLPIEPPQSASQQTRSPSGLRLAMLPDGSLLVDGRRTPLTAVPELLMSGFTSSGTGSRSGADLSQGKAPRSIPVEILVDATLGVGRLKPLLDVLQQAGVGPIKLLTRAY